MDESLLEDYERLIRIVILGRLFDVPDNNLLLRQLQYVCEDIGYGKYCWNGECRYCEVHYRRDGEGPELAARACRIKGQDGMRLTRLAAEVKYNLSEALATAEKASE
jgi:hypothetical protein